jgi:hypothetical protein
MVEKKHILKKSKWETARLFDDRKLALKELKAKAEAEKLKPRLGLRMLES